MDPKLVDTYSRVLLNERKHHKSDAKPLGDKGGKLQSKGAAVVKPAKASEFDFEKDVKLTSALGKSGAARVKNLKKPQKLSDSYTSYSKFDSIFKRTLMEEVDELQPSPAPEGEEPEAPEMPVENEAGETGDIVSDLQDVVSKLNDILTALGAEEEEEEEEGEEGHEDVNSEIDQVEGPANEEPANVAESLSDLKGAILKLKTGLNALTNKKNVVSSKLKVSKGKADAGESVGKPLAKNTSLQSKSSMHVTSKLKPGQGLFERRR